MGHSYKQTAEGRSTIPLGGPWGKLPIKIFKIWFGMEQDRKKHQSDSKVGMYPLGFILANIAYNANSDN